jgi:hypothetical protein
MAGSAMRAKKDIWATNMTVARTEPSVDSTSSAAYCDHDDDDDDDIMHARIHAMNEL